MLCFAISLFHSYISSQAQGQKFRSFIGVLVMSMHDASMIASFIQDEQGTQVSYSFSYLEPTNKGACSSILSEIKCSYLYHHQ